MTYQLAIVLLTVFDVTLLVIAISTDRNDQTP